MAKLIEFDSAAREEFDERSTGMRLETLAQQLLSQLNSIRYSIRFWQTPHGSLRPTRGVNIVF
jgi:hypothetical protein